MDADRTSRPRLFDDTRLHWSLMSAYERFEQIVVHVLSFLIAAVISIAVIQLIMRVFPLVIGGALDPLEHDGFQTLFGMIMTVLIALEFKHSILRVAARTAGVIQVKTVLLVALLALSRKFIILDSEKTGAATIAALAGAALVLGIVYWLLRDRDAREEMADSRN